LPVRLSLGEDCIDERWQRYFPHVSLG
jgi:hypothetical protein